LDLNRILSALQKYSIRLLARESFWRYQRNKKQHSLRSDLAKQKNQYQYTNLVINEDDLWGVDREDVILLAKGLCTGVFPLLSYGNLNLGALPDWQTDFISGYKWTLGPSSQLECMPGQGADIKAVWELSRLQFLPLLAAAHRRTQSESYRDRARQILSDWIEKNPVGHGPNWTVAMEAALRAISICLTLDLLCPFAADESLWVKQVEVSLNEHLLFIHAYNEFSHLHVSNHYLSNVIGMFVLLEHLEGPGIEFERELWCKSVFQQMEQQTLEDGFHYEASTGYHYFVTQLYDLAVKIMNKKYIQPSTAFLSQLEKMQQIIKLLGSQEGGYIVIPQIGDCDDGRVYFASADLQQMAHVPIPQRNSLRMITSAAAGTKSIRQSSIQCFPDTGLAVLQSENCKAVFCAIANGIQGEGSHTHNDKLSILLRIHGYELFCDPGTAQYSRDPDMRNCFRGTSAHNTVRIANAEQNQIDHKPQRIFQLGNDAHVTKIISTTEKGAVIASASHTGYKYIGAIHHRRIELSIGRFTVLDEISGVVPRAVELFFHLPEIWNTEINAKEGKAISITIDGPFKVEMDIYADVGLSVKTESCGISYLYGTIQKGTRIIVSAQACLPVSLKTEVRWNA